MKTLLIAAAAVGLIIGSIALFFPTMLLADLKFAEATGAAVAQTRTVGVLILAVSALNFLVHNHGDSPTMRAILAANLLLHLGIMPLDPIAFATGAFHTYGSFVPNTILHIVLATGFGAVLLRRAGRLSR